MKTRILAIILSVCLVGAIGWGFTNYNEVGELKQTEMQLQKIIQDQSQEKAKQEAQLKQAEDMIKTAVQNLDRLENEIVYLNKELAEGFVIIKEYEEQLKQAKLAIDDLISERKMFRDKYDAVSENYNQLEEQYNQLLSTVEHWETTYDDLLANRDRWVTAYNDLLAEHNQLNEQMKDIDYLQFLLQLLL